MDKIQLLEIAEYAYKEVPFYSELAEDMKINIRDIKSKNIFNELPLIDKDMFQKGSGLTLSRRYYSYPMSFT